MSMLLLGKLNAELRIGLSCYWRFLSTFEREQASTDPVHFVEHSLRPANMPTTTWSRLQSIVRDIKKTQRDLYKVHVGGKTKEAANTPSKAKLKLVIGA